MQRPVQLARALRRRAGHALSVELSVPPVPPGSVLVVRGCMPAMTTTPGAAERELIVVTQAPSDAGCRPARGRGRPRCASVARCLTGTVGAGPLPGELVDIGGRIRLPSRPDSTCAPGGPRARRLHRVAGQSAGHFGTAVSNADGRFVLDIPRLPLRVGATDLVARVVPARRYIRPAVSNEVRIVVTPPEPVSVLFFVLPLVASAGLAGLYWLSGSWPPADRVAGRSSRVGGPSWRWRRLPSSSKLDAAAISSSSLGKIGSAGVSLGSRGALSLRGPSTIRSMAWSTMRRLARPSSVPAFP